MSFGIQPKRLKCLIDLYHPNNHGEELRYMIHLKGEEQLFRNLETCPFQGISVNSIEDREQAFGINSLPPRKFSVFLILEKAISAPYICIPIILSFCLLIYNIFGGGSVLQGVLLLSITIINWFLRAIEELYLSFKWAKNDAEMNQVTCTVVRENKREKIFSSQLTVGDVVEFREGDTISADGWLIQGFDITIIERHLSELVECEKDTLRKCITDIKATLEKNPNLNEKSIPLDQIRSPKSPVLLGGSIVKSGEGRMMVLCVGKYSRQGQFLTLSRQKFEKNLLKYKMQIFKNSLFGYLLFFAALYVAVYFGQNIQKAVASGSLMTQLQGKQWQHLYICLLQLVFGIPLGLYLGLLSGMVSMKMRMWFAEGIWIDYAEDLPKMAAVTEICYDRDKDWGKVQYREWWNEQKTAFCKDESDYDQKQVEMTEQSYMEDVEADLSKPFKDMMRKGLKLKGSEQPGHQYFISPESTTKKNTINDWNIFQESSEEGDIHYICVGNTVKFLTMGDKQAGVVIKGEGRDILRLCSTILMKSSGEVQALTAQLRSGIQQVIESMERRLVTTHAIAFIPHQNPTLEEQIRVMMDGNLTLVCVLGVSNSRDHSDYEIVRQLREAGIGLVLVSSRPHAEAVNRSKFIGINTIEKDSLVLDSNDFAKVIGGVICFSCKKTFCQCANDADQNPRLKNLEEFRRITKYLKVMSSASFFEKYSLLVGYKNVGRLTAYMGTEDQDRPAQAAAYISVATEGGLSGSQLRFPSNSLRTLQSCILWSRLAAQFARKLLQLVLPASLVPAALLLLCGILFRTVPLAPLHILWVCLPLCIATAINLSWENPPENFLEPAVNFGPDSPLLPEPVRKQVISQCIIQTLLLMILLITGHNFLPESADAVDDIIGNHWQAKYSSPLKDRVASGLGQNFLLAVPSYPEVFHTYGIYSRHLTIIFNIYALMQIFNYFNCRKVRSKQINVLEGLGWHNAVGFFATLAMHCLFLQVAPQAFHIYPNGLTLQQWLLSIGLAIVVWIVGFLVRLLPDSSRENTHRKRWANKSYNIGVKLVGKSDKFYEFDRDQDANFKFH